MPARKKSVIKKVTSISFYPYQLELISTITKHCNDISRSDFIMDMLRHFLRTVTWSTSDKQYPIIVLRYFGYSCVWQVFDTGEQLGEEFQGQYYTLDALKYAFERFPHMIYNEHN